MRTHQMVEVGEEVRVFDVNSKRRSQPNGGWPGEVVKAGPKLIAITYGGGRTEVFRRSEGRINDNYGHRYYLTLEEADAKARQAAATAALCDLGVDVSPRCRLTVRQLEAMVAAISEGHAS